MLIGNRAKCYKPNRNNRGDFATETIFAACCTSIFKPLRASPKICGAAHIRAGYALIALIVLSANETVLTNYGQFNEF
jgi:hypothetical protein